MYPASRLAPPASGPGLRAKLLSLVAVLVLLLATLEIFFALKPGKPYLVEQGVVVDSCSVTFGGRQPPGSPSIHFPSCQEVVPDQKVPQRVGIGLAAIAIVFALMVAASRQSPTAPAGT